MTLRTRVSRRLFRAGVVSLMLSSTACAYMEFSPTPPPSRKTLARAVVTPNPPRPGTPAQAADAGVTRAPLADPDAWRDASVETGPAAAPAHTVRAGETLYAISRRYGVDVFALADHNDLAAPFSIYAGQRLDIPPAGARAPGPAYPPDIDEGPMVARLPAVAEPLPTPPGRSGSGFVWPLEGKILSSFGPKARGLRNDGINIAAQRGASVRAIDNGVVAYAGNELRGFGNMVLIKHDGSWVSTYAHNDRLLVQRGDRVRRGQTIAKAGSTGRADEPQLHFELRKGLTPVDPLAYLPAPRT